MPQIDKAAIARSLGAVPIEEKRRIAQELGATPIAAPPTSPALEQPPLPATQGTEFGLLFGVDPRTFGQRIAGGVASILNYALPSGSTPRPEPAPQLSPQEEIGAKAVALSSIPELMSLPISALRSRLPSTARA